MNETDNSFVASSRIQGYFFFQITVCYYNNLRVSMHGIWDATHSLLSRQNSYLKLRQHEHEVKEMPMLILSCSLPPMGIFWNELKRNNMSLSIHADLLDRGFSGVGLPYDKIWEWAAVDCNPFLFADGMLSNLTSSFQQGKAFIEWINTWVNLFMHCLACHILISCEMITSIIYSSGQLHQLRYSVYIWAVHDQVSSVL